MALTTWSNGLAGTLTGPELAGYAPAIVSGAVIWLDSQTGASGNAGTDEALPMNTFANALGKCGSNTADFIIAKEGHAETITSQVDFTGHAGVTVLGLGSGITRPRFTCGADINMVAIAATDIMFENLFFPQSTVAHVGTCRVKATAAGFRMKNCYFQCGALDSGIDEGSIPTSSLWLAAGADRPTVWDTSFVATGGSTLATQPTIGLFMNSNLAGAYIHDCTFDGGSGGWNANYSAFEIRTSAPTYPRLWNNTYTGYADAKITVTGVKGSVVGINQTGVGSFSWVP